MKNFKKYDTALRDATKSWADELKDIDILIGIPCWNNEDTIGHVVSTVGQAMAEKQTSQVHRFSSSTGSSSRHSVLRLF